MNVDADVIKISRHVPGVVPQQETQKTVRKSCLPACQFQPKALLSTSLMFRLSSLGQSCCNIRVGDSNYVMVHHPGFFRNKPKRVIVPLVTLTGKGERYNQ